MSYNDNKELYSKASKYYVETNEEDAKRYAKSMKRKEKHNKDWEENKVNINEIIDKFTPEFDAKENHEKMIFMGEKYSVIADMASGYLRIYDREQETYIKLDGTPGADKETHFKIRHREEM